MASRRAQLQAAAAAQHAQTAGGGLGLWGSYQYPASHPHDPAAAAAAAAAMDAQSGAHVLHGGATTTTMPNMALPPGHFACQPGYGTPSPAHGGTPAADGGGAASGGFERDRVPSDTFAGFSYVPDSFLSTTPLQSGPNELERRDATAALGARR